MPSFRFVSPAKINLTLDVIRKRADHYHEVEMIMQTIALYDVLHLSTTREEGIFFTCPQTHVPLDGTNLVVKAAEMVFDSFKLPGGIKIHLEKRIPVAAGLGGGSGNGAAVLKALTQIYSLPVQEEELLGFASRLGSDVPFFIKGGTSLCRGRGTDLYPLPPLPDIPLFLVVPPLHLKTPLVYRELQEEEKGRRLWTKQAMQAVIEGDLPLLEKNLGNDLTSPARRMVPSLDRMMEKLTGEGLTPHLTGSGPTLFLLPKEGVNGIEERLNQLLGPRIQIIKTCTTHRGIVEKSKKEGLKDETGCYHTGRG